MTYDFDISNEVSLSKILDAFIIEDEKPEVIISFLKQHEDNIKDILKYSLYCNRLFQLDFFLRCGNDEQEYVIDMLEQIDQYDAALLAWQILQSNSKNAQHLKYSFRQRFRKIFENIYSEEIRHPYSNGHEVYVASLDALCFKSAQDNLVSRIPNIVDANKLLKTFKYMSYSLFQKRLIQYDFFAELDIASKYAFLNAVFSPAHIFSKSTANTIVKFILQILDSDEDIEIKRFCVKRFKCAFSPNDILDEHERKLVDQCTSFAEFMMKSMIFNAGVTAFTILYLLLYHKQWIEEWCEYDETSLIKTLNVPKL